MAPPPAARQTLIVLLRRLLVLASFALVGCQVTQGCPDIEKCVSSQAEADKLNAGATCGAYVYCPSNEAGPADATVTVDDGGASGFPDVEQPEAAEFIDAGCVDGSLPPKLGIQFSCGDASCWSGSEFCVNGFIGNGPVCLPMPCRCGAVPTCWCLPACPFESCTEDAGAIFQQCSCP